MRPTAGVWRKGNRRARRGEPRPRQTVYWPICGSPAPVFRMVGETEQGDTLFVWQCSSCSATWSSTRFVPLDRMQGHRHHVPA